MMIALLSVLAAFMPIRENAPNDLSPNPLSHCFNMVYAKDFSLFPRHEISDRGKNTIHLCSVLHYEHRNVSLPGVYFEWVFFILGAAFLKINA
jgi:hypothetical protein